MIIENLGCTNMCEKDSVCVCVCVCSHITLITTLGSYKRLITQSERSRTGNHLSIQICICMLSCVQFFCDPHGLQPTRLLCPWTTAGKNTGVGYYALPREIFLTQGSNLYSLCLMHWQGDSLPLSHLGSHIHLDTDQQSPLYPWTVQV